MLADVGFAEVVCSQSGAQRCSRRIGIPAAQKASKIVQNSAAFADARRMRQNESIVGLLIKNSQETKVIRFICSTLIVASALSCTVVTAQDLFSGIDPDGFDRSVRPQDDLYQFVNGRWLLHTQIPSDKSNYGSFSGLADAAQENIRAIIEESAKNPVDANSQKVGDLYASFMNEELIEQKGFKPVQAELEAIDQLSDMESVFRHMGYLNTIGIGGPVGFFVTTDAKNSSRYLSAMIQSGTSLPDRDYYLEDEDKYVAAREALKSYIATV